MAAMLMTLAMTLVMTSQMVTSKKPNIVILLADDLGYTDPQQHDPDMRTPAMMDLQANGVFLNQSYVLPTCTPTRSALLTGRYCPLGQWYVSSALARALTA
jgi:arylsulfatase A-like enzyme